MNNNLEAIQKASYVAIIAVQSLKAAIDVPLLSKDGQLTATARAFAKEKKKELKNFNI